MTLYARGKGKVCENLRGANGGNCREKGISSNREDSILITADKIKWPLLKSGEFLIIEGGCTKVG